MSADDLLALLGLHHVDPRVEAALTYCRVRARPELEIDEEDVDGPIVETQAWVKNSHEGIEFGFQDEAAWIGLDETEFGKRPMVLNQIYFYGHHDGVEPFRGRLPFGLRLSDDRATVRHRMTELEPTRHSHLRDTWDAPRFRMTVGYVDQGQAIDFVFCTLHEPPLPALGYALAAVPSARTLVDHLDRSLGDPELQRMLGPLGLRDRLEQIKDAGEADFFNPFGFTMYFVDPSERTPAPVEAFVFSGVMFVQERELDARGWKGTLPYELSFDDSPEMAVRKVGRPPDHQQDEAFSGAASWYEPTMTLRLFYSTMDNRILRVSVNSPGFGPSASNA